MLSSGLFFQEMLALYIIAVLGYAARKKQILTQESVRVITQILLYMTLPALILHSLNIELSIAYLKQFSWLMVMSAYILVLTAVIAGRLNKSTNLSPLQKPVYESLILFGNQGFIGYAVSFILLGEEGIIYLTVFNIFYLLFIWAYGIHLFTKNKNTVNWKAVLLNPGIFSTSLGFVLMFVPFTWPSFIAAALESVGTMTVPLSMILIGALVANVTLKDFAISLTNMYLWKAALLRLLAFPMLLLPFAMLGVPFHVFLIAVIVSAMPSAPTICIYCEKYGGDSQFASFGVMLTTLLCILTIPLLYVFLNAIQHFAGLL
ncbi:AEC family transporter [Siminovitchia sediminis]|uniref:AEC family transporter n=1 Tax=Siminovitchia sediminis TaxID=1274353 RepID=A0ABW4KG71_9BACI